MAEWAIAERASCRGRVNDSEKASLSRVNTTFDIWTITEK